MERLSQNNGQATLFKGITSRCKTSNLKKRSRNGGDYNKYFKVPVIQIDQTTINNSVENDTATTLFKNRLVKTCMTNRFTMDDYLVGIPFVSRQNNFVIERKGHSTS